MKLNKEEKNILLKIGYLTEDFEQIERSKIKLTLKTGKTISIKKAKELLDLEDFISGFSRSCYHFTAVRNIDEFNYIFFSLQN